MSSPLKIRSLDVSEDAVEAVVACDPKRIRTSQFPELAEKVVALLPGLVKHECDNEGLSFEEEVGDTELPHLLEHVALELMRMSGSKKPVGRTRWDFGKDGAGVFRVTLRYDDDLVCLGALKDAQEVVDALAEGREPPDVRAMAEALRELRERPRGT